MRVADAADVKELAAWSEEWCVSAFLPAHQPEGKQDGDLLRLKNMLRDAERELITLGMRQADAARMLESAIPPELSDRTSIEFHRGGVAIFCSPGLSRAFRVPVAMPALVAVGSRFHVKPVIGALSKDLRFFVLTLTKGRARVALGSLDGLRTIEIPQMPTSFGEVAQFDEASDSPRWDELNRADHLPEDVLRYVRAVESAVTAALPGDPLVIGGTDALVSAYVGMSSYRAVVDPPLAGNPDAMSDDQLHAAALELAEARASQALARDVARFDELNGTGLASGQMPVVLRAAVLGRVDTLFVAADHQIWGIPGTGPSALATHEARMPGDGDLLDLVVATAWQSAATIHVVPATDVPGSSPIAAIFRY